MSKINTNMAAVTTLYHLTNKEGSMNKALERISSGLRLNHAVDDAAGASIVNRMTSQIKGLEAAIRNAADAISLTQTAEGSLEEVTQILHRMRELSVQAANGVYTGQDRQAINNEIVAMQNELQRIAESSTFNGVKMLNGDFQDTTFQVGFQPNDTATLSIEDVRPSGLGEYILSTSNIDASTVAGDPTAIANKVSTTISANETTALSFKSVNSSSTATDGVLSNNLQYYVDNNTAGSTNGGWSVSGDDTANGAITIDSSGVVTVTGGADYETKAAYTFDVVFTTNAGDTFTETVTLNVSDLAEEQNTISGFVVPTSVQQGDEFGINIAGEQVTATITVADNAYSLEKLKDAFNARITAMNTANAGTVNGEFSVSDDNLVFIFNDDQGDVADDFAEVQTGSGLTLPTTHTVGDVYTLTVDGVAINTPASTATTDYDSGAKIATALEAAKGAANFSISESGGEIVVTWPNGSQADATIALTATLTDNTGFAAGSFSVTSQGSSQSISDISYIDFGRGTASVTTTGVTAVTEVLEVITIDVAGTAAAAALGTDVISLTSDGNAANTVTYTTQAGDGDSDIATGLAAALSGTENFTATASGSVVTITMIAGTGAFDETNVALANDTVAGNVASVIAVSTPGVDAVTAVNEVITIAAPTIPTAVKANDTFSIMVDGTNVTTAAIAADDASYDLSKLVTALNTAEAAGSNRGTFAVSGSDITFTFSAAGPQNSASDGISGVKYNPIKGTVAKDNDGVAHTALTTATNADRDGSTATSKETTLSVVESSQVILHPLNIASPETTGVLSDVFKTFVDNNPAPASQANGGFSLTGADADKFEISKTGVVKSKAKLDYEASGSAAGSNTYKFEITYTDGTNALTEKVTLNVTDDPDDAGYVNAAAQPFLGNSKSAVGSLISEKEDLTIFGNVGTKVIDINGGSSARDVVTAVNAVQGETGVYANAQTRMNITFPDQAEALSDTVSFKLYGKNSLEQVISGNVDLGVVNGRDASLRNLADAVNSASGATGITAKVSTNGATLTLISNEGYDIVIEGYAMSASTIDMNVSAADPEFNSIGVQQAMQEGSANNNSMRVSGVVEFHSPYIFSVSTDAIGNEGGGLFQQIPGAARLSSVADLNVLTVENAKRMLTAVDGALVRVDLERSDLGATMSRMEHTIANLSNINVNTKAARSRIQDADIAAETVELNRHQVLSQAAQAMLAQANRTSQSILSLLQG